MKKGGRGVEHFGSLSGFGPISLRGEGSSENYKRQSQLRKEISRKLPGPLALPRQRNRNISARSPGTASRVLHKLKNCAVHFRDSHAFILRGLNGAGKRHPVRPPGTVPPVLTA